ncbi:nuclear transport factor 2 family protein [Oceanicoccus sagamiensis]|uniref:SnoaL-like domain-containing protein n=1 Tax=Oceanicoccus sagamiensis TaxID=716816 RepID=A0A1X9N862_9GAMM|nr:nuclear transport factor 2 family protein [Oceanicoccus sagamiensis]ARN74258.1 hypothetical protein BST96_09075 [Oceanicoccus sagamiensis]
MEQQLQRLLDRQACEDVLIRYGRTLDWLDQEGQASCYWQDAQIDYGFFKGSAVDWIPVVMGLEEASPRRWHMTSGIIVEVNGNKATSECYGLSMGSSKNEEGGLIATLFGGRYLDELEKRDGQWRLSKRTYIADWSQSFPDGLDAMVDSGFILNILQITQAGHKAYQPL